MVQSRLIQPELLRTGGGGEHHYDGDADADGDGDRAGEGDRDDGAVDGHPDPADRVDVGEDAAVRASGSGGCGADHSGVATGVPCAVPWERILAVLLFDAVLDDVVGGGVVRVDDLADAAAGNDDEFLLFDAGVYVERVCVSDPEYAGGGAVADLP